MFVNFVWLFNWTFIAFHLFVVLSKLIYLLELFGILRDWPSRTKILPHWNNSFQR